MVKDYVKREKSKFNRPNKIKVVKFKADRTDWPDGIEITMKADTHMLTCKRLMNEYKMPLAEGDLIATGKQGATQHTWIIPKKDLGREYYPKQSRKK